MAHSVDLTRLLLLAYLATLTSLLLSGCSDDGSTSARATLTTTTSKGTDSSGGGSNTASFLSTTATVTDSDSSNNKASTNNPAGGGEGGGGGVEFPTWERSDVADARFLLHASFGPTRKSMQDFGGGSYNDWINSQIALTATLHRSHYRARVNPRLQGTDHLAGKPRSECSRGARWRGVAFGISDIGKAVTTKSGQIHVDGVLRSDIDPEFTNNGLSEPTECTNEAPNGWKKSSKTCESQGSNLRNGWSCSIGTDDFKQNKYCQQGCFDEGVGYDGDDCSGGWPNLVDFEGFLCGVAKEAVGSVVTLSSNSNCANTKTILNPRIWLSAGNSAEATVTALPFDAWRTDSILLLQDKPDCGLPMSGIIQSGTGYYVFDSRIELLTSTVDQPRSGTESSVCANVERNFLNEDGCVLGESCAPLSLLNDVSVELSTRNLQEFFSAGGRYVYSIAGLPNQQKPCRRLSRFEKLACGSSTCTETASLNFDDKGLIASALEALTGDVRDINVMCSVSVPVGVVVELSGSQGFFRHVHSQEHNTYDFSEWVTQHPGGEANIKKWATGDFRIQFPGTHALNRWTAGSTQRVLSYVGVRGGLVSFADLPPSLKTEAIAAIFRAAGGASAFMACGSPGETANDPWKGHNMAMFTKWTGALSDIDLNYDDFIKSKGDRTLSKTTVWFDIALGADDQLRQRVAWALSQIFVIGTVGLTARDTFTEDRINFYDIFVRNAFGYYRDVLREVTYSPLMGDYLTYRGNKAFDAGGNYPDENYAREVMDLFTIGQLELNVDGTRKVNSRNEYVPTFDNDDIMSFARVFTGLDRQLPRANIEESKSGANNIDPMVMTASKHDAYPKSDLGTGYLGDGYPLCGDIPNDAFLLQGARYDFLGYTYTGSVLELPSGSKLKTALKFFAVTVELGSTVSCTDIECDVDGVAVVKVDGGYYEFVPPTCVHPFFANKSFVAPGGSKFGSSWHRSCANPTMWAAGTSCCNGCTNVANPWMINNGHVCASVNTTANNNLLQGSCNNTGWKNSNYCQMACWENGVGRDGDDCSGGAYRESRSCAYPGERVRLSTAKARCTSLGMVVCKSKTSTDRCGFDNDVDVWTPDLCSYDIWVGADGQVTSHESDVTKSNPFYVQWRGGGAPDASSCPAQCESSDGGCLCPFTLEEQIIFTTMPSKADVQSKLKVGAFVSPGTSCSSNCAGDVKVYAAAVSSFTVDTVFEVEGRFYRNMEMIVRISTTHSFRNPPVFILKGYPNMRASLAEVESLLDHLMDHQNVAPFVALRLIQRIVTSNPTPAYVEFVANAFKSAKKGDLAATIAALLLHEEARGAESEGNTGKLREPLIKLVHFMRSMEYEDSKGRSIVLDNVEDTLAQMPYYSPSVFNFYSVNYQPSSFPDGLVGPEFQIFTAPAAIGFLNGILSMIDNGLSHCEAGIGFGDTCFTPEGSLAFPESETIEETWASLDLLLTGSRLGSKWVARSAYETSTDRMKAAQRAIAMSAEFNNLGDPVRGTARAGDRTESVRSPQSYRALVKLFLDGGADTFNLLVPHNCGLYNEYVQVRSIVALQPYELLAITATGQPCSQFGIHMKLPYLKSLYDDGHAAFVANVGALVEPTTKAQLSDPNVKKCVGLYSHSDQTIGAQTLKCQTAGTGPKGAGGRMADRLAAQQGTQYMTTSYSVAGTNAWSQGVSTNIDIISRKEGIIRLEKYNDMRGTIENISSITYGNAYCDEYAKLLAASVEGSEELGEVLNNVKLVTNYKTDDVLSQQLHQVARLIKSRDERKAERDLFFVELAGFDTHTSVDEVLLEKFTILNDALEGFVAELKAQSIFDSTVIVTSSDFGRTLTSNGLGTDHAWAGNYFVIGGDVKGGKIYNDFPSSLLQDSPQDAGRGRLIPKYPWENIEVPVAEWMGLETGEFEIVFPNLANFNRSQFILDRARLFKS
eukprot:TRINITY_DN54558_c0_g1_i1.p1 TRINITY_DN54558_c0_g1~~TRINITY_DN54558_c0_g1_i1.p1  ORF type:complete len:1948 (+),score=287.27 TRINITY_DN54558_c0_g1_i1:50-5845(+)